MTWTVKATLKDHPGLDNIVMLEKTFKLTVTSICENERLLKPSFDDMTFIFRENLTALNSVVNPTSVIGFSTYREFNNDYSFCGTITYVKTEDRARNVITMDSSARTLTINPTTTPLYQASKISPTTAVTPIWYDHSLIGVH